MLFSEPKIPQFRAETFARLPKSDVSVLFSEPKIPQFISRERQNGCAIQSFSALQRAENSSIIIQRTDDVFVRRVSVLFSEPKIPQFY